MHNQAPIQRRKSTRIYVGNVPIGDGAPIAVQSMTNTRTTDVKRRLIRSKRWSALAQILFVFLYDNGRRRSVQAYQTAG
ncbi:GcpE protein [Salmonella enterica subsp. enterica]|nr:GcpE protein [Salmonella enterica subsp. enterica]